MLKLYPLKFKTIFKDKIWGGSKIKTLLNKDFSPLPNCGETWELSGVAGDISSVSDGALKGRKITDLIADYKEQLVGGKVYDEFGTQFPLLIKYIDANKDLSIQVHPDDELAKRRHNGLGKTEMWYILQADENASLISGFTKEINKKTYLDHFNNKKLSEILNREKVQADDVFFIPAGRVHTIGKGILLTEIQRTSDITYRIYDFDRKGADGKLRELHTQEAVDAIDYSFCENYKTEYQTVNNEVSPILSKKYFTTNKIQFDKPLKRNYQHLNSFVIFIGIEGESQIEYQGGKVSLNKGDVVLLPAILKNITLQPISATKILEVYV